MIIVKQNKTKKKQQCGLGWGGGRMAKIIHPE